MLLDVCPLNLEIMLQATMFQDKANPTPSQTKANGCLSQGEDYAGY